MAREFDPLTRDPVTGELTRASGTSDPIIEDERSTGMGMMGLLAALVIAVVLGLVFWNMSDTNRTTATNTSPGMTTGSAPPAPPASPASPAPTTPPSAPASR